MVDNMFSLIFNSSSSSSMKILDEGIYVHDSYYNNETITIYWSKNLYTWKMLKSFIEHMPKEMSLKFKLRKLENM